MLNRIYNSQTIVISNCSEFLVTKYDDFNYIEIFI